MDVNREIIFQSRTVRGRKLTSRKIKKRPPAAVTYIWVTSIGKKWGTVKLMRWRTKRGRTGGRGKMERTEGAGEIYIESGLVGRTKCSHIGETWEHPGY